MRQFFRVKKCVHYTSKYGKFIKLRKHHASIQTEKEKLINNSAILN